KPTDNADELNKKKLALAELCHRRSDECIKIAPNNPECHLLKGSCYAMQASTWGVGFQSLRVCKPMDIQWEAAMELPSKFTHPGGVTTVQLAKVLRAILFRAMPDSWWFRFLAGARGNKEKAYHWMTEAVSGTLKKEPMIVIEYAATALCYGRKINNPKM